MMSMTGSPRTFRLCLDHATLRESGVLERIGADLVAPCLGPIVGHATATSLTLWLAADTLTDARDYAVAVQCDAAGNLTGRVWRAPLRLDPGTQAPPREPWTLLRLTGLAADQEYRLRMAVARGRTSHWADAKLREAMAGEAGFPCALARTFPRSAARLRLLAGSCLSPGLPLEPGRSATALAGLMRHLDAARGEGEPIRLLLLMGDQVYSDPVPTALGASRPEDYRELYRRAFGPACLGPILARLPVYMLLDDHEVADGWEPWRDRDESSCRRTEAALAAYAFYQQAHGPAAGQGTRATAFEVAGFPFFLLDGRGERQRAGAGVAGNRMLSDEQLGRFAAWLGVLDAARNDLPRFVASSTVLFPETADDLRWPQRSDTWSAFPATRNRLLALILDNNPCGAPFVFLAGDAHSSMVARLHVRRVGEREDAFPAFAVTASGLFCPFVFTKSDAPKYLDGRGGAGQPPALPIETRTGVVGEVAYELLGLGNGMQVEARDSFADLCIDKEARELRVGFFDRVDSRLSGVLQHW